MKQTSFKKNPRKIPEASKIIEKCIEANSETKILDKILKIKVPTFPIDGEFLKQKGMLEGQSLGNVLKTIEKEWLNNNFKISNERVNELIQLNST